MTSNLDLLLLPCINPVLSVVEYSEAYEKSLQNLVTYEEIA